MRRDETRRDEMKSFAVLVEKHSNCLTSDCFSISFRIAYEWMRMNSNMKEMRRNESLCCVDGESQWAATLILPRIAFDLFSNCFRIREMGRNDRNRSCFALLHRCSCCEKAMPAIDSTRRNKIERTAFLNSRGHGIFCIRRRTESRKRSRIAKKRSRPSSSKSNRGWNSTGRTFKIIHLKPFWGIYVDHKNNLSLSEMVDFPTFFSR